MLQNIFNKILDLFLPNNCISCKTRNTVLCDKCIFTITETSCKTNTTISIFNYKDKIIKKAIWSLKYKNNKNMSVIFAKILHDRMLEELSDEKIFSDFKKPLLIPIPLSKSKRKIKGYNHAELIAIEICKKDKGNSFTLAKDVLYKIKDTPRQVSIKTKIDRIKNLKNCFRVKDNKKIYGRNIILIDDVTTTGATIAEAKKALLSSGARKVIAFTVAH